jgi:hypothetical protein
LQANAADLELYAFADELVDVQLVLLNHEEAAAAAATIG